MLTPSTISAVILDRDGVINIETGNYVKSVDEWHPIPGSIEAIVRMTKRGYRIFVATNQSGITRGLYSAQALNAIHQAMLDKVERSGGKIEGIFYCPHVDEDHCLCRKPKPGLLHQIADRHDINLRHAVMVGDSMRDIQAAISSEAQPVLVGGDAKIRGDILKNLGPDAKRVLSHPDLAGYVDGLLTERNNIKPDD